MNERRLAILHTESSLGWGGQEIRILSEAEGLIGRGHRITLLAPQHSEIHAAALRRGVPVCALDISAKRPMALFRLRNWLNANGRGFDVINTHSSTDAWLVALASRLLAGMPPTVRTRHVSTPINRRAATRWLYQTATAHIVTTGEALRQQLNRDNGFALERMTSVRTGIDLSYYKRREQRQVRLRLGLPDVPTLGIVATLRDWKGHRHLLEAFAALKPSYPDWRLVLIGDGPERGRLESQALDLRLGESITFAGNREDVPDWLSALDVFALPSYGAEGVPQGIMQAMACGLPVVATPVGAVAEAVQDGQTGLMTRPQDPQALAEALSTLMADPALRARMGKAGEEYARRHFGIEVMVDAMLEVFHRVARR
ncbi:MAG TPA: glycosyltransferase family 4 protein [Usitatibacteraceae bacterium]|nr:glycosyltransferase family 4 protein [Usitatibacteraceae bacterium]